MNDGDQSTTVIVLEPGQCRIASGLDLDTATTLVALISEDPATWEQAQSVWPRYQTRAVCEFVGSLQFEEVERDRAFEALENINTWVVLDFIDKRVFTSPTFIPLERDAVFAMYTDENGDQHCPISIHLPPWWELHAATSARAAVRPRESPINRPYVDRVVLYGDPLLEFIATKTLAIVASEQFRSSGACSDWDARYSFTLQVHREWLMSSRADLGGKCPRQLLHGALRWSEQVTWGQRIRFEDGGPMIAAPNDWIGFENAPVGSQEICIYFSLCRHLINASWDFLAQDQTELPHQDNAHAVSSMIELLRGVKRTWLNSPFESGSTPNFIIQCDRRRVPRGAGVTIEGIEGVQSDQHLAGCDCPLCEMISDGSFGVGFCAIDGHHLELDDDFAFSQAETFEEWEKQQQAFAATCVAIERERTEREVSGESDHSIDFGASGLSANPLPPDLPAHASMAFAIAEMMSELQSLNAPHADLHELNESFAKYRRSDARSRLKYADELKATLETFANRFPKVTSISANLQSLIDEASRRPELEEAEDDDDLNPF